MAGRKNTAESAPLSVEAIVDVAGAFASEDRLGTLTMRGVADALGVSAMALYRHVRTKEELLGHLANRYLGEIDYGDGSGPWQDEIADAFRAVRRLAVEHPELGRILSAQPVDGAAAYRGAERVIRVLEGAGASGSQAVVAFDSLRSFTIGFCQRETARTLDSAPHPLARMQSIEQLPADEFGRVRELAGELVTHDEARFEAGLALMIAGIEQEIAA